MSSIGCRLLFICVACFISLVLSLTSEELDTEDPFSINDEYSSTDLSPCTNLTYNRTCCRSREFHCSNGYCIPMAKVCDSKMDCPDSTDEVGCLRLPCDERVQVKCEQACLDLPGNKSRCTCYEGYTLRVTTFRQTCVDVDECQIGVHVCTHGCENRNGSFECTCKEGFNKNSEGHPDTCKADDQNIQVLYSSDSWIYSYSVSEHKVRPVVQAGRVDEMDYDPATEMVYWSTRHRVARSYLLGAKNGHVTIGHPQSVGPSSIWHIKNSLAIDWTAGNLYWISVDILNVEKYQILVSKLDGRYVKTLLDDVPFASSLVVDPEYGKMYWTSGGDNAEIGGAWMNGMYRRSVLKLSSPNPISLTLDHMSNGRLYWSDSKTNIIYFVNTDGTRPTEIVTTTSAMNPLMMDVFENYLYWVTRESNQLVKFDKFGRGNITSLVGHLIDQTSVKVHHKRRVEIEIRKSGLYCRKQCSHLCLHVPRGYSCSCPDGSRLLLLMGEILCDAEREEPLADPLDCNCEESNKICNATSPYSKCHCKLPCEEETESTTESYDDYDAYNTSRQVDTDHELVVYSPGRFSRVLIIFLSVTPIFICFALSFCKRPERSTSTTISQGDNFNSPIGFNAPDSSVEQGYGQGGPTIVKNTLSTRNNSQYDPLYQVPDASRDVQGSAQLLIP